MMKKLLQGLLITSFIVFLSFLYLLFRYSPRDLWEFLWALDEKNLALSFLCLFFYHTFDMLRVIVIARAIGLKYSILYGYLVSFVNTFGATITPAHLGGEILPLYTLARKGGEVYQIATVVTLKGLSGLIFYLIFFPLTLKSLILFPKLAKEIILILLAILLISLILYGVYLWIKERGSIVAKEREFIAKLRRNLKRYLVTCRRFYRERKTIFILAILFSILLYLSFLAIGIFLLRAINPEAAPIRVFLTQLPLLYAIFISPTPGGSGVGEFGAIPVFAEYLPEEFLGIFIILWRWLSQYFSAFLGGIIFLFFLARDVAKYNKHS